MGSRTPGPQAHPHSPQTQTHRASRVPESPPGTPRRFRAARGDAMEGVGGESHGPEPRHSMDMQHEAGVRWDRTGHRSRPLKEPKQAPTPPWGQREKLACSPAHACPCTHPQYAVGASRAGSAGHTPTALGTYRGLGAWIPHWEVTEEAGATWSWWQSPQRPSSWAGGAWKGTCQPHCEAGRPRAGIRSLWLGCGAQSWPCQQELDRWSPSPVPTGGRQ